MEQIRTYIQKAEAVLIQHFGESAVSDLILSAVLFLLFIGALVIIRRVFLVHLQKITKATRLRIDDLFIKILKDINRFFLIVISAFFATRHVTMPDQLALILKGLVLFVVVHEVIKIISRIVLYVIAASGNGQSGQASNIVKIFVEVILWCVGLMLILSNLGFNVTSLIASLGIGGIAISLALQNLLSDIFSSLAILIDKPFEEGHYIVLGPDHEGEVKKIGLKTTRIQTLHGEELIVSNTELTNSRIQNYKRMERRRQVIDIGVVYSTPKDTLKKIPQILEDIVASTEHVELEWCGFTNFGPSSLDFTITFFMLQPSKKFAVKTRQDILFKILDVFLDEGIDFAFPTQTMILENTESLE